MTDLKRCSKCGQEKPATLEYWHRDRAAKDGLRTVCKACAKKRSRRYRQENADKVREANRRYRKDNLKKERARERRSYQNNKKGKTDYYQKNRDQKLLYAKQYRENNREKIKQYNQAYGTRKREHERERLRRFRKNNPEKIKQYKHNRRALKLNAPGTHTAEDIQLIYDRQGGRCWWCQCELNGEYHVDHRIPLSRGGSNDASNIVISCAVCNQSKYDKLPHEWCGRLL